MEAISPSLDWEALNYAGFPWKRPRGNRAEPAGLEQAVLAGAWPLADTKLVMRAVLIQLAFLLLTRLAHCKRFPVTGKWLQLRSLKDTNDLSLMNFRKKNYK